MSGYKIYGSDAKLLGTLSTEGRITTSDEAVRGVNELQALIRKYPDGVFIKRDEPKEWWRR